MILLYFLATAIHQPRIGVNSASQRQRYINKAENEYRFSKPKDFGQSEHNLTITCIVPTGGQVG